MPKTGLSLFTIGRVSGFITQQRKQFLPKTPKIVQNCLKSPEVASQTAATHCGFYSARIDGCQCYTDSDRLMYDTCSSVFFL